MPIIVQISELTISDAEGNRIFEDLHFQLQRGEWACILGPESSGKTLLLRLIYGDLRPERGQILVGDRNVLRASPERLRQLRRRLGILPEEACQLSRRTLEDSVIFKLRALDFPKEEAQIKALEVLGLVGLGEHAGRCPLELDPVEQQLFQLSLALSHDPVLLLLDDPLRDLPPTGQERLLKVLERVYLHKRLSILMTAREARWGTCFPVNFYALEDKRIRALAQAGRDAYER